MATPDVIIAGLGTMGAAAAMALTRAGKRVLAFDRFAPPHLLGEHGGRQRMFRMSYYEHADYVPLLVRARDMWLELDSARKKGNGRAIYEETGAVYVGRDGDELIEGSLGAARTHGLAHEDILGDAIGQRFPQFAMGYPGKEQAGAHAVWEGKAGFLRCEEAVGAMIDAAQRAGAVVRSNEPVLSWEADRAGVRVLTEAGIFTARALVLCAGPWSGDLLLGLGLRLRECSVGLRVTRQVQAWVRPEHAHNFAAPGFCCWARQLEPFGLLYGFPVDPTTGLMKVAVHRLGPYVNPDSVDRVVSDADVREVQEQIDTHLCGAGRVAEASVCLYTNSADLHFIIDRHPAHPNVVLACGFSGHGFKFAPVVGEVVARLLDGPSVPHPAVFLGLERFAHLGGTA